MYLFTRRNHRGSVTGLIEVHGMAERESAFGLALAFYAYATDDATDPGFRQDGDVAIDGRSSNVYDARDGIPAETPAMRGAIDPLPQDMTAEQYADLMANYD